MDESGGGAPYKAGEWVRQRLRWLVKLGRYEGEGGAYSPLLSREFFFAWGVVVRVYFFCGRRYRWSEEYLALKLIPYNIFPHVFRALRRKHHKPPPTCLFSLSVRKREKIPSREHLSFPVPLLLALLPTPNSERMRKEELEDISADIQPTKPSGKRLPQS